MPGLGRMSRPVPQPVLVISCRTGKFFDASGSDPQPGLPPGPPLARDDRQVVRVAVRIVAEEKRVIEDDGPAVAAEGLVAPLSSHHFAPTSRQV